MEPVKAHLVLVVDPERDVALGLSDALEAEHYDVHAVDTLEQAQSMLAAVLYAVVIVNSGFVRTEAEQWRFVRYVRAQSARTRVLFLRPQRARSIGNRDGYACDALLPRSTDAATIVRVVQHLAGLLPPSFMDPSR